MALLTGAAGCGGRHTTPGDADGTDGDGDADGTDGPDGDADADADDDREPVVDSDEGEDADEGEPDADADVAPSEETWLLGCDDEFGVRVASIAPDPDGGVFVAGENLGTLWVASVDAAGGLRWSRRYGQNRRNGPRTLRRSADGRLFVASAYLAGSTSELGGWVAELDVDGSVIWQRRVEPGLHAMEPLSDGTVVVASQWDDVVQLMRLSPEEGVLWSSAIPIAPLRIWEDGLALAVTEDETIFVVAPVSGGSDLAGLILALDVEGDILWAEELHGGDSRLSFPFAAAATEDGGIVLTGQGGGLWTARLDMDGEVVWSIVAGHNDATLMRARLNVEEGLAVAVGPGDVVLAVGHSTEAASGVVDSREKLSAFFAQWMDPAGRVIHQVGIWREGETSHAEAHAASASPSGGWYVGGLLGWNTGVLASLDAAGSLGEPCEHAADVTIEPRDLPLTPVRVTVPLEPGGFVVSEADAASEEVDVDLARLCR